MTYGEYKNHYVNYVLPLKKKATRLGYTSRLKYFAELESDDIRNLDPMKVQRICMEMAKNLSPATVKTNWVPFHAILKQAEADGLVDRIPKPKLPKLKRIQQPWLNLESMWMLFDVSVGLFHIFYKFLCETGCRIGEALDITWEKIDFDGRSLLINSSQYIGETQSPKTEASNRQITLSNELAHLLCDLKPVNAKPTDHVWYNPKTKINFSKEYFRLDFRRCLRIIGVRDDKKDDAGFHMLRLGNATLLANELKIPETVIAYRLGHENPGITFGIYVQKYEGMDKEAALKLGKALYERKIEK